MGPQGLYCFFSLLILTSKSSAVNHTGISMLTYPRPDDLWNEHRQGVGIGPTCVDIPSTMKLCDGIGYKQMRLPNLLGHDTVSEVVLQANYWVVLLNLKCQPDTQLFLCSLFSPVCLDRPIYPCRELCEAVRAGCESRMIEYGYPWPEMVRCDKFPINNDMCISVQTKLRSENDCGYCKQAPTYENILDNFCRSDFVVKAKIKKIKKSKVTFRKGKVLKLKTGLDRRKIRRPVFRLSLMNITNCCKNFSTNTSDNFLIMGKKLENGDLKPTLVMPWQRKASPFKMAVRMFKKFDCSNPSAVFNSGMVKTTAKSTNVGKKKENIKSGKGQKGQERGQKKRRKDRRRKKGKKRRSRRRNRG